MKENQQTLWDKLTKFCIMLTCIAIIYYLIIFLPKIEQNKAEDQKQIKIKADFKACMDEADKKHKIYWNDTCKSFNKAPDCSLSVEAATVIDDIHRNLENGCREILSSK